MLGDPRTHLHSEALSDLRDRLRQLPYPTACAPHVVKALAVAKRPGRVDLVQAGAATAHQLVTKMIVITDLHDQAGRQKILLDLLHRWPLHGASPFGDCGSRNHDDSSSGGAATITFQRRSTAPVRPRPGSNGEGVLRLKARGTRGVVSSSTSTRAAM